MYRPIHHGYAGLPPKEAWLPEKNTKVTIPWRPSKLKIQAGTGTTAPTSSCWLACTGHIASGILPYDAWTPGRLFFGAYRNIYGSDSRTRISHHNAARAL